jgi:hypothetical protein
MTTRRLAAILAADVVAFATLVGQTSKIRSPGLTTQGCFWENSIVLIPSRPAATALDRPADIKFIAPNAVSPARLRLSPARACGRRPRRVGKFLKERRVGMFVRLAELLICLIVIFFMGAVLGWW